MKKVLMLLSVFLIMGFLFTGIQVASAAEECIVGPLRVSNMPEFARYGDNGVLNSGRAVTDRVSSVPRYAAYGDNSVLREGVQKGIRVSTPPKMAGPKEQSKPFFPQTTC